MSLPKQTYVKKMNILKKICEKEGSLELDKKRNVNEKQKEIIWKNSDIHTKLDPNVFRIDILGNVIIKKIRYSNNLKNRIFAGEYEHLKSYSNGGRSDTDNVCLLNVGINRSKGKNEMYKIKYYEYKGLFCEFGMSAEEFLKELKYDAHAFCEEYDLHFFIEKVNGKYTIASTKKDDENYSQYENQVKHQEIYENRVNTSQNSALISVIVVASIFIWEQSNYIAEKVNDTTNYVSEKVNDTTNYITSIFISEPIKV